jgi:hypothetical protein
MSQSCCDFIGLFNFTVLSDLTIIYKFFQKVIKLFHKYNPLPHKNHHNKITFKKNYVLK